MLEADKRENPASPENGELSRAFDKSGAMTKKLDNDRIAKVVLQIKHCRQGVVPTP